ncbi:hypothetical protein [Nodularia sp. NIES-3585]|uniref:hypothetical protein n=1 Tax=Nodularia sp. NIES-3585 TaxID=1973477 RepID=UPI000B70F20E|nr:hypothetical protein [Nodularia sp. NIES-3585]GAX37809.1 hypothetical protein NIES3585_38540 [Nodularia sp. NIES-3585]
MNTVIFAITLATIHLFSGKLRVLKNTLHSRCLSFGSGVSVAYVFIHILPELSQAQATFQSNVSMGLSFLEHHVYLVALLDLTVFYQIIGLKTPYLQHRFNLLEKVVLVNIW